MTFDFNTASVTRIDPNELARRATLALNRVDAIAREMERKWGYGRLMALVPDELALRFWTQHGKMKTALQSGDQKEAHLQCDRMANAWRALDAAATDAGHQPINPKIFEAVLSDGTVIGVVADEDMAHAVDPEGRKMQIYTMQEIARLIEGFPTIAKIKTEFPGATVTSARETLPPSSQWLSADPDDKIPF